MTEHFTVEEFVALFRPHYSTTLELVDGRIYCNGQPFLDLALRYLAALGHKDTRALALASHYLSTYCIHEAHDQCRLTCKTCDAPCRCSCHGTEGMTGEEFLAWARSL